MRDDPFGLDGCHQETKMIKVGVMFPNLPAFDSTTSITARSTCPSWRLGWVIAASTTRSTKALAVGPPEAGHLRRHVPYLLRVGRSVSSGLRTPCERDHGGHPQL